MDLTFYVWTSVEEEGGYSCRRVYKGKQLFFDPVAAVQQRGKKVGSARSKQDFMPCPVAFSTRWRQEQEPIYYQSPKQLQQL